MKREKEPFLLLSTGTWTICANPFSEDLLSKEDLENDCLNFLRYDGGHVRVVRLFLGREHEIQVSILSKTFGIPEKQFLKLEWDTTVVKSAGKKERVGFPFEYLSKQIPTRISSKSLEKPTWQEAYYQLVEALVSLQVMAIHRAMGSRPLRHLIIEGGFTHNDIFVNMLQLALPDIKVKKSDIQGGSARGVFELVL